MKKMHQLAIVAALIMAVAAACTPKQENLGGLAPPDQEPDFIELDSVGELEAAPIRDTLMVDSISTE